MHFFFFFLVRRASGKFSSPAEESLFPPPVLSRDLQASSRPPFYITSGSLFKIKSPTGDRSIVTASCSQTLDLSSTMFWKKKEL